MKANIHPKYQEAQVICACGERFTTRATKNEIHVDICSACHPFYTGKQKLVDTAGRVDRFNRKYKRTSNIETTSAKPAEETSAKPVEA